MASLMFAIITTSRWKDVQLSLWTEQSELMTVLELKVVKKLEES
jgi:hypothetical protein